jgi:hypothetical protein
MALTLLKNGVNPVLTSAVIKRLTRGLEDVEAVGPPGAKDLAGARA